MCLLQGTLSPSVKRGGLLVFVGDHGVALPREQGGEECSAFPSVVTPSVAKAMAAKGAAGAVLANTMGMDVRVIDVGMAVDVDVQGLSVDKSTRGTKCFTVHEAMTVEECQRAMQAGQRAVQALGDVDAVSLGEIGIGNTTPSAALVAAFAEVPAEEACGRGTGLDESGVARKVEIVKRALALHQQAVCRVGRRMREDSREEDAEAVLAAVGGLEIAAIVGAVKEAAARGIAVLVDGFIATAAVLVAIRANPEVARCLFLSTSSAERGHAAAVDALSAELTDTLTPPALDMSLALGEGTGGVLCFPVLQGACAIASDMMSLEAALQL